MGEDNPLIWIQRDRVRLVPSSSLERCPHSCLGLWGQVKMGQRALDRKSPGCQLEGMLEASQRSRIRKLMAREGRQLGGMGTKGFFLRVPLLGLEPRPGLRQRRVGSSREGGGEISVDTRTKLPRSGHSPALEKLAPGPVAAAHAPAPGREAAQLPAAEAPPACDKDRVLRPRGGGGGAGMGGVSGEGPRVSWKGQVRCEQRVGGWAYGGQWGCPKRREGGVTHADGLEA